MALLLMVIPRGAQQVKHFGYKELLSIVKEYHM